MEANAKASVAMRHAPRKTPAPSSHLSSLSRTTFARELEVLRAVQSGGATEATDTIDWDNLGEFCVALSKEREREREREREMSKLFRGYKGLGRTTSPQTLPRKLLLKIGFRSFIPRPFLFFWFGLLG